MIDNAFRLFLIFGLVAGAASRALCDDAEPADDAHPPLIAPERSSEDYAPPPLADLGKKNKIRVVYFVASDREPAKDYQAKTEVLLAFVRDVYRRDLQAKGIKSEGPDFFFEDGHLKIDLLKSEKPASHFNFEPNYTNQGEVWTRLIPEIEAAYGPMSENFYFVLSETYAFGPFDYEWPGNFALGGYRSAIGGAGTFSSWILRDEFCATTIEGQMKLLADRTSIEGRRALGSRQPNSPRFEFIEDGFGAVVHELAHAFGCPHDVRQVNSDIMAQGFRRFSVNYLGKLANEPPMCFSPENARFLAQSRFLCDDVDATDNEAPKFTISFPNRIAKDAKTFSVNVKATDNKQLAALILFTSQGDTIRGGKALSGTEQEFDYEVQVSDLKAGELDLYGHLIDHGGNIAVTAGRMQVEEQK